MMMMVKSLNHSQSINQSINKAFGGEFNRRHRQVTGAGGTQCPTAWYRRPELKDPGIAAHSQFYVELCTSARRFYIHSAVGRAASED